MKKPLLLVLILIVVAGAVFVGLRRYTKSFSPEAVAEYSKNGLEVEVLYSRPSKKNRLIFGREQDNALVPYDKVWRTGANEATTIRFGQDVLFAGKFVKAGQYSLWTIPGPAKWKVVLNREVGQWGTSYNDGQDLFRAEVNIRIKTKVAEMFAIYFEDQPEGPAMILQWDQTEVIVPIRRP